MADPKLPTYGHDTESDNNVEVMKSLVSQKTESLFSDLMESYSEDEDLNLEDYHSQNFEYYLSRIRQYSYIYPDQKDPDMEEDERSFLKRIKTICEMEKEFQAENMNEDLKNKYQNFTERADEILQLIGAIIDASK